MKLKTPQRQFRKGTAPQEAVMPHSMDNRQAGSPSKSGLSRLLKKDRLGRPQQKGR